MFRNLINAFKNKDIRKKLLLTLLFLFLYRVGCALVCPGFNLASQMQAELEGSSTSFFSLMNMMSGEALSNGSILALGVSPYITASIVIQLLTVAIPSLERLAKQGEDGRTKISFYTRVAALVLALAQATGIVIAYSSAIDTTILNLPKWIIGAGIVLILTAGAMFTVWLGERITDLGVGNGMSLLIFVGILASSASSISQAFSMLSSNIDYLWTIILFFVAVIVIFALIVFVDGGERRINLQYAKQIKGRKMYGGQSSFIPIKVNSTGVMPIIFASALITLPQLIINIFWPGSGAEAWFAKWLGTSSWLYIVILALLIFAFSFFYSQITFDPDDISRRIQQQGGFITGIRPGKPTADHLRKIARRITVFGAIFLACIALIPSLAFKAINDYTTSVLINSFSATSLMIIVSVALEFDKSLEAQMLMRTYKGFLN
ncbi:MAG: preprotein translocase subunit SecY [Candidatus Gastranaerophilales bacterium]|nr:preprotein translocase subunit SecY [Clostridia bacterium]MBQ8886709.1 preprotein translocase subunit SecY [Candidatus Gastranaerophilales bacterium]